MLYGFINLTWFDIISVGFTLLTVVLVQISNSLWPTVDDKKSAALLTSDNSIVTESLKTNEIKSLISNGATTKDTDATAAVKNGKIRKQQSEQNENSLSFIESSITTPSTPLSPAQLPSLLSSLSFSYIPTAFSYPPNFPTVNYPSNGNGVSPEPPLSASNLPDNLNNEYNEDGDTLSVENLFSCDQTEVYASKKINYIIDELIQTEESHVKILKNGLKNYGDLQKYDRLPEALSGEDKQKLLLGNIAEILKLHEREILPLMLRNKWDLKSMFDEMTQCIDKNQFYCYITFTMHKKESLELCKENREFFEIYEKEINDRLGIGSFLAQPIHRLTKYPLLLQQLIAEFYKSGINCKPVLVSLCKLETRMRRLLEAVNQSEEILSIDELLPELNIELLGSFRRSTELDAYSHRSRKKFRAKVFLFDYCLLCTEMRKSRLVYRNYYAWNSIELKLNNSKNVTLLTKAGASSASPSPTARGSIKEEYEFSSSDATTINQWLRCACRILEQARIDESQRGKLVLPMDLVLGVVFAIWFIWQYL